jgi:dodecin
VAARRTTGDYSTPLLPTTTEAPYVFRLRRLALSRAYRDDRGARLVVRLTTFLVEGQDAAWAGPDASSSQTVAIERNAMSVYRVTELIGTSTESWEDAAASAVTTASTTLRDLRVAEVVTQDIQIKDGSVSYRIKLQVSFKHESEGGASPLTGLVEDPAGR